MENIGASVIDILEIVAGAITSAIVIGTIVWKVARPHFKAYIDTTTADLRKNVNTLKESLEDLQEKKVKDYIRLEHLKEQDRTILKAMFAILMHLKDGNNTGLMDAALKDLQLSLVKTNEI